jgi:hypothetical protein
MYVVQHVSEQNDEKFIGMFQQKSKAIDIINEYKKKEGFINSPNGFEIIEVSYNGKKLASGTCVFVVVSFLYDEIGDEYDVQYHRIFNLKNEAKQYEKILNRNTSRVYDIQEVLVDKNFWVDGYVTIYQ